MTDAPHEDRHERIFGTKELDFLRHSFYMFFLGFQRHDLGLSTGTRHGLLLLFPFTLFDFFDQTFLEFLCIRSSRVENRSVDPSGKSKMSCGRCNLQGSRRVLPLSERFHYASLLRSTRFQTVDVKVSSLTPPLPKRAEIKRRLNLFGDMSTQSEQEAIFRIMASKLHSSWQSLLYNDCLIIDANRKNGAGRMRQ